MKSWSSVIFLFILSASAWSQEQLALRLNEKGIMKMLQMAVKYNSSTNNGQKIEIPQDLYKFTLKREDLLKNPIIPIVNEISNLNLNRDLDFYLHNSKIKIVGVVDPDSISTAITRSHSQGFDIRLGLNLKTVTVTTPNVSLCEDKRRGYKSCGSGLKATISNLKIKTFSRPVKISAVLRLRTDGNVARAKLLSVSSNLESKYAPALDINFDSVTIPRIAIVINGQETELDTSRLKSEILERKSYLAGQLLNFVAGFITSDLVEMINVYLINKKVETSWQVYRRDEPINFDEFISRDLNYVAQDNTYVRPAVRAFIKPEPKKDTQTLMLEQIADIVRHAQIDLSLKEIKTPGNKDLELAGMVGFVLNNRSIEVRNTLGNRNRSLPELNLTAHRQHDINLAISEPLVNGALDVVNSTGLFQELFDEFAGVDGFSIRNVKFHFTAAKTIVAVANVSLDLNRLQASNLTKWFKNKIAAFLERNNNKAVIYFPIEIQVIPVVKRLANGGVSLDLKVLSPFKQGRLINYYNYPSNVDNMTEMVREGVLEELQTSLGDVVNKTYNVDLNKFLNQGGVEFLPKEIAIDQSAYLLLNLDIKNIKFDSQNPNKR